MSLRDCKVVDLSVYNGWIGLTLIENGPLIILKNKFVFLLEPTSTILRRAFNFQVERFFGDFYVESSSDRSIVLLHEH